MCNESIRINSKQVQVNEFLLCEVPEHTGNFTVRATVHCENGSISFYDKFTNKETLVLIPPGNYSIVGMAKDQDEDFYQSIMNQSTEGYWGYYNEDGGGLFYDTAKNAICGKLGLLDVNDMSEATTLILKKIL